MIIETNRIKNKIKGAIAEQICRCLFEELGCTMYATGQEHVYPNLFTQSNKIKRQHHEHVKKEEIGEIFKSLSKDTQDKITQFTEKVRFGMTEAEKYIKENPDFTAITPAGAIIRVESKYRRNGELTNDEKKELLKYASKPIIFLTMLIEPYLKILIPTWDENDNAEDLYCEVCAMAQNEATLFFKESYGCDIVPGEKEIISWIKNKDGTKIWTYKKDGKEIPFSLEEPVCFECFMIEYFIDKIYDDRWVLNKIAEEHIKWWKYKEHELEKDGSIIIDINGLRKDSIIIPKALIAKYKQIIKDVKEFAC